MAARILIATSIRSLGELMQQALQETGHYRAELVDSGEQALEIVKKENFSLAIVDFGVVPDPVELIKNLRAVIAELEIVAMPYKDWPESSEIEDGLVDAWLSMPFYLPNLLETLEEILGVTPVDIASDVEPERVPFPSGIPQKSMSVQPAPEWLQDVNRVAQHLTRLSLESTAQAALITRGSQLWAYAGQLPQNAAEELARSVGHYWANDGGSDLARFIRLDATNNEYMMYATSLGGDYVLALAFETEMSFTEMRVHAGDLARKLSHPPAEELGTLTKDTAPQQEITTEDSIPVELPPKADLTSDELPPIPPDWRPDQDVAEGRQAFFEDLLSSMEIPQPDGVDLDQPQSSVHEVDIPYSWDQVSEVDAHPQPEEEMAPTLPEIDVSPESLADTRPTAIEGKVVKEGDEIPATNMLGMLEPGTATLHNLTYASVLVPRLPRHHLVGEIAAYLNDWVADLSIAYGWRLEHLAVRPDYLHWIAVVPPNSSPGLMVHNVRRETSQRMFAEFPRLEQENPSGEFWASGYLIVNGRDPFSRQMVHEFIGNIRSRQGAQ